MVNQAHRDDGHKQKDGELALRTASQMDHSGLNIYLQNDLEGDDQIKKRGRRKPSHQNQQEKKSQGKATV